MPHVPAAHQPPRLYLKPPPDSIFVWKARPSGPVGAANSKSDPQLLVQNLDCACVTVHLIIIGLPALDFLRKARFSVNGDLTRRSLNCQLAITGFAGR